MDVWDDPRTAVDVSDIFKSIHVAYVGHGSSLEDRKKIGITRPKKDVHQVKCGVNLLNKLYSLDQSESTKWKADIPVALVITTEILFNLHIERIKWQDIQLNNFWLW